MSAKLPGSIAAMSHAQSITVNRSIGTLNLVALVLGASFVVTFYRLFSGTDLVITAADLWVSLALSGLILFLPQALLWLAPSRGDPALREAGMTVATVVVLCIVGWLSGYGLAPALLTWVAIGSGVVAVVLGLARGLWQANRWTLPVILALSAVVGVWLVAMAWGHGYQSPDFYERIPAASAKMDTLFHAAIANSIVVLGYPSTALDGAPYLPYHWGSHWIFAQFSQLLDIPVLTFYNVSFQIIILPLFFKAMGLMTLALRRARGWNPAIGVGYLVVLMVATITFWTATTSRLSAVWTKHLVVGESYASALTFGLLFSSFLVLSLRNRPLASRPKGLLWVAVPLMLVALGLLKISVMVLAAGAYWYWLLRSRGLLNREGLISAMLVGLAAYGVMTFTWAYNGVPGTGGGGVKWFYFLREVVGEETRYKVYFFILHYLWTWVYLGLMLFVWRIMALPRLLTLVSGRQLIEAEILLAVAVAGFIPGEVLAHRGGAFFYFSDVQRWLAIAMVLALLPVVGARAKDLAASVATWSMPRIVLMVLIAGGGLWKLADILHGTAFNIKYHVEALDRQYGDFEMARQELPGNRGDDPRRRGLMNALAGLSELTVDEKSQSCIYIPKVNTTFWSMIERPGAVSFVPPAVTGIRAILGVPVESYAGWGLSAYAYPDNPVLDLSADELQLVGAQYGCSTVFVLRDDSLPLLETVRVVNDTHTAGSLAFGIRQ